MDALVNIIYKLLFRIAAVNNDLGTLNSSSSGSVDLTSWFISGKLVFESTNVTLLTASSGLWATSVVNFKHKFKYIPVISTYFTGSRGVIYDS